MNDSLETNATKTAADTLLGASNDSSIESAERELSQPGSEGMRILQSVVADNLPTPAYEASGLSTAAQKISQSNSGTVSSGLPSGFLPGGSSALSAVSAGISNASSASSAIGLTAQAAAAAPVALGKEAAAVANANAAAVRMADKPADLAKDLPAADKLLLKAQEIQDNPEFQQLQAMLSSNGLTPAESQMLSDLIQGLSTTAGSPENVDVAIQLVTEQISALTAAFDPYMENLSADIQSSVNELSALAGTDLGVIILESTESLANGLSGELSNGLTGNLAGSNLGQTLSDVGATLDDVLGLVGGLPDGVSSTDNSTGGLDVLTPIVDSVVDSVVTPIADPIVDAVVDPVTDVVDTVVEPVVTPIVDTVVDTVVKAILRDRRNPFSSYTFLPSREVSIAYLKGIRLIFLNQDVDNEW